YWFLNTTQTRAGIPRGLSTFLPCVTTSATRLLQSSVKLTVKNCDSRAILDRESRDLAGSPGDRHAAASFSAAGGHENRDSRARANLRLNRTQSRGPAHGGARLGA